MNLKTKSTLAVLVVLIVFLASCSKKAEYVNAIPADASAVVSIDLKSLAEKAGLDGKDNEAMKQKMLDALKNDLTAASFQHLEKIIKSPAESGIDIKSPLYFFNSVSFPYPTVVAKVGSIDNLRKSIEVMAKEQISQPIAEGDGYSFALVGSDNLLAFNETTALFVGVHGTSQMDAAKEAITGLLKQTTDNSINKNVAFQKMQKSKGDVTFFASMDAIPETYAQEINIGIPSEINLKDVSIIGGLSFEKGKIAINFETYSENEQVNALLKKQEKAYKELNNIFLKNFPESTLAFFNIGTNGEELYNLLVNNQEFRNNVSIAKADEVKKLFNSFNGDISVGLINVTMSNSLTFVAYAEVTNGDALKTIYAKKNQLGLSKGEDILQLSENEYVYKTKGMNIFFGVRGKELYATNDELLYKNIGKPVDKSVADAPYASEMKGKSMFFVVNANAILELPVVKMLVGFGGEEFQTYYNLASQASYFEVTSENGEKTEMALILKDKENNALKQIIDFAKQFVGM